MPQPFHQFRLDLVKWLAYGRRIGGELDNMVTKLRFYRTGKFTFLAQRHGCLLELLHHDPWLKITQVTALASRARIIGMFFCQCSEVSPAPELLHQLPGLVQ